MVGNDQLPPSVDQAVLGDLEVLVLSQVFDDRSVVQGCVGGTLLPDVVSSMYLLNRAKKMIR